MLDPSLPPATLAELAQRSFVDFAARPCLGQKHGGTKSEYEYATFQQVGERVKNFACGLVSLGIERGDRVAILAENSSDWAVCDIACQCRGAIAVPMFSTLPSSQVAGILRDCGARAIVVSDKSQAAKIREARAADPGLPELQHVIAMEAVEGDDIQSFASVEEAGAKYLQEHPQEFETLWPAAQPDDVATIIYTSGTTGDPKGVVLSHRNICANADAIATLLKQHLSLGEDDIFLSFLPLAHIFERTAGFWVPVRCGCAVAYAESLRTIDKNLKEVRPTVMFAVPRFYEMLGDKIAGATESLPEDKRAKYTAAIELARKAGRKRGGVRGAPSLSLVDKIKLTIFEKVVYSKVRDRFGGRLKAFVSGGAPLSPDVAALLFGLNITLLEGYGLTETSPVIAVNLPGAVRIGTVGEILENVECKIAEDGEICVRGDSITRGYWNRETETREAIDSENWFHTGDIGQIVPEGSRKYLQITDRKKDLLVLANGKKVAPAPIEMRLSQSPLISQVVLLGDKQKAVSALVVPQMEALRLFAAKQNLGLESDAEIIASPAVIKRVREEIDAMSKDLADFEKIKKFSLLEKPFSVESGELTPTLKVKRRVVAEKFGALVLAGEDKD
jgi:long-chain acyl-CoA synthetase